jgi:hypothetical protein
VGEREKVVNNIKYRKPARYELALFIVLKTISGRPAVEQPIF